MSEQAELTRPKTGNTIQTVNPATGEPGRSYDEISLADALAAAAAAHAAFLEWRRTTFAERVGHRCARPRKSSARARRNSRG